MKLSVSKPRLFARTGAIAIALLALAATGGCESEDEAAGGPAVAKSAAELVCESMAAYVQSCGAATPCDEALVADCADVTGVLADSYLTAVKTCIDGQESPISCFAQGVSSLETTQAHRDLAAQFCSECALGVPGCEDVFFSPDGGDDALGLVFMPFGDDLVAEITTECATGLTCATTFLSCAQEVIAKRAIPEQTLTCVVDNLLDPAAAQVSAPSCGDTSGAGGSGSSGSSSGSGGSGSGSGGSGGGGPQCHGDVGGSVDCTALPVYGDDCYSYEPYAVEVCMDLSARGRSGVAEALYNCVSQVTDACDNETVSNCMYDLQANTCIASEAQTYCGSLLNECPAIATSIYVPGDCESGLSMLTPAARGDVMSCYYANKGAAPCDEVFGMCQAAPDWEF